LLDIVVANEYLQMFSNRAAGAPRAPSRYWATDSVNGP
jgi:hypothetical protein